MRLFRILTITCVVSIGAFAESGLHYGVSGWDHECEAPPPGCESQGDLASHFPQDVTELNKCLINYNYECNDMLDVQLYIDQPEIFYQMLIIDAIPTMIGRLHRPLFPGPWVLSSGTIRIPKEGDHPPPSLNGGIIVFKEGPISDYSYENLSEWTQSNCSIKTVEEVNNSYEFSCPGENHPLLKPSTELTFIVTKDQQPVNFEHFQEYQLVPDVKLQFNRAKKTRKIPRIGRFEYIWYDVRYLGGPECKEDIPDSCSKSGDYYSLTSEFAKECLTHFKQTFISRPHCLVQMGALLEAYRFLPTELHMNGKDVFVPVIFIDTRELLFVGETNPPLTGTRHGNINSSFDLNRTGSVKLYLSETFGASMMGQDELLRTGTDYNLSTTTEMESLEFASSEARRVLNPLNEFNYTKDNGLYLVLNQTFAADYRLSYHGVVHLIDGP